MDTSQPSDNGTSLGTHRAKVVGRLLILIAAVMWSTSGLFVKNPIFDLWPPESRGPLLAFWRATFAGMLLLPFVRQARWTGRLIPLLACFALMNVTYLSAMALTTAANAIWLQSAAPLWVFLLGLVCVPQRPSRSDLLLLVFGMLGVGTVVFFEIQGQQRIGVACGLLSGVFFAAVIVSMRALRGENTVWLVALCQLVSAAVLLPYVLQYGVWPSPRQLCLLATFGLLQMGLPYLLFCRGLRAVASQEAAGIGLLEPILVPVWVYLTWAEVPARWTLTGGGLILSGLAIRYLGPALRSRLSPGGA